MKNKDINLLIWLILLNQNKELITDSLTQLTNRRGFDVSLSKHINIANRYKRPLSLILLDVCSLKKINDSKGHIEGDKTLQKIAQTLQDVSRNTDTICRIGGDEFALILPETNMKQAQIYLQRITKLLQKDSLEIHYGISSYPSIELFQDADQDLIKNKKLKGNT